MIMTRSYHNKLKRKHGRKKMTNISYLFDRQKRITIFPSNSLIHFHKTCYFMYCNVSDLTFAQFRQQLILPSTVYVMIDLNISLHLKVIFFPIGAVFFVRRAEMNRCIVIIDFFHKILSCTIVWCLALNILMQTYVRNNKNRNLTYFLSGKGKSLEICTPLTFKPSKKRYNFLNEILGLKPDLLK